MKLKIKEVLEGMAVLQKVINCSLPAKVSYNIMRNLKKVEHELKPFEESRLRLVQKYGKPDDDGKVSVTDENISEFYKEVSSLLDEEVEVDIRQIGIEQLEGVNLTPNEIQFIDFIIEKET
jgi:sulfatase maturation enzyme AslB (radical SAM superfamily)